MDSPQEKPSTPTTPTSSKSTSLPWIIVGILAFLLVLFCIFLAYLLGTGKLTEWFHGDKVTTETEEDDTDGDTGQEDTEDDSDEDSGDDDTDTSDDDTSADDTEVTNDSDMTELWSEYYNSSWYIGFKYPVDLVVGEDSPNPSHTTITLESGDGIGVLTIWLQSEGIMDDILANMLANQCTDTFTYSNETFGTRTFRKALDVPMAGCLENLGITRDQELAAYGVNMPGEVIMTIRSDGLNQEQLEALLGTVYGE